jgi:hypothetical protein
MAMRIRMPEGGSRKVDVEPETPSNACEDLLEAMRLVLYAARREDEAGHGLRRRPAPSRRRRWRSPSCRIASAGGGLVLICSSSSRG